MLEPDSDQYGNPDNDGEPGDGSGTATQRTEAEIRAEVMAEYESRIKTMIEDNAAYKAMQRVVTQKDREIQNLTATTEELKRQAAQITDGFGYMSETLMRQLPESEQERVKAELNERRLRQLEAAQSTPQRQYIAPQPEVSPEFERAMEDMYRQAQDSLEATVKAWGLDPKVKGLDYGAKEETFPARLNKLNASIAAVKKAQDEAEVNSVKSKGKEVTTRTTGGIAVGTESGTSFTDKAFSEMWANMKDPAWQRAKLAERRNTR